MTGSQVVDADSGVAFESLKCLHMALCQVNDVDVVANSSSVMGGIVVSEDAEGLKLADGHLGDIGNQVVGNTLGILTDESALMGSDRVEVSEKHYVPLGISGMKIGKDLLQHALGLSVRVSDVSLGALLGDGHEGRVPVYGCG